MGLMPAAKPAWQARRHHRLLLTQTPVLLGAHLHPAHLETVARQERLEVPAGTARRRPRRLGHPQVIQRQVTHLPVIQLRAIPLPATRLDAKLVIQRLLPRTTKPATRSS